MQAAVRTLHTEIKLRGDIPEKIVNLLRAEYGKDFHIESNDDSETMNAFESEWYKTVKAAMTPGDALKIYRENNKLTQTALGKMLGGIPRQQVSNMENGIRPISIAMAKKLAAVFGVPADRFIDLRTP